MADLTRDDFGDDFTWGVAHASYQVEGAWNLDGKMPSIWDTFSHRSGKIKDGSNGDVACDFYHRYEEDTELVRRLGFAAQRFSISWPRVLPAGTGAVNPKGLDFYSRLVDACLERGVEPWVTLYHWDLPEALQVRGGWAERDIVGWFGEYAGAVAEALGDRVKHWMIFNEPLSFVYGGHLAGAHAPGIRSLNKTRAAIHHVNLSQAEGARAVRAASSDAHVGTTHIIIPPRVRGDGEGAHRAAQAFKDVTTGVFLEPNFGLGYPDGDARWLRGIDKYVRPGDDERIKVDWDFLGVQYYTRFPVSGPVLPYVGFTPRPGRNFRRYDITAMGWEVEPIGLYEALDIVHGYGKVDELFVTENGAAYVDKLEDGRVKDRRRIQFYDDHLEQVRRARQAGMPVHGYFCWSLMDNFEWAEGYVPRFGLVHVDYGTQGRTVKDSGYWFQKLLTGTSERD